MEYRLLFLWTILQIPQKNNPMRHFYIVSVFYILIIQFLTATESMGQLSPKIDSMVNASIVEFNKELHSPSYSYADWRKNDYKKRLAVDTNTYLRINKNYMSLFSLQRGFSLPYFPKNIVTFENGKIFAYRYVDSISLLRKTTIKNIRNRNIGVVEVSWIDFVMDTLQINVTLSLYSKVKKRKWSIEICEGMIFYFKYDYVRKDWICVKKKKWGV